MVGRLVQDEQVGGARHQARQFQPAPLADGQGRHRDRQVLLPEETEGQQTGRVLLGRAGKTGCEGSQQGLPGRYDGGQFLRQVSGTGRPACGARVGAQVTGQDAQQRRLARAVGAGHEQAVARPHGQLGDAQPVADGDAGQLGEGAARGGGCCGGRTEPVRRPGR